MAQTIFDSFTGAADTDLGTHDGETGANWARWLTLGADVTSYELDGAGRLRGVATAVDGYLKGSAAPVADVDTYYELAFAANSFNTPPSVPTVSLFASKSATVGGITGAPAFIVEAQHFSGSIKLYVYALTDGFSASPNFFEIDTGVNTTGAHTLRVEIPAARDRLLVKFDGSTVYDQALPRALDAFVAAGFAFYTADEAADQWVIDTIDIGTLAAAPPPSPRAEFWKDFHGAHELA